MKYLIVSDWSNTHGNHAGMVHMCHLLENKYPRVYKVLIKKEPKLFNHKKNLFGQIKRIWDHFIGKPIYYNFTYPREYLRLCNPIFENLKQGDEVFLLEYLAIGASQLKLAQYLRKKFPQVQTYALSHLTVKLFKEQINRNGKVVRDWAKPIDKMLTLGSSLSEYFKSQGIPEYKISTGFHYVDIDYYHKFESIEVHQPLRIIAQGNLQRDYSLLSNIVRHTPTVHYIICHGRKSVDGLFDGLSNVELKGYLSEDELRHQMDLSDISINVMEDTIGSNVITTSLAMGLAMIVSDVGSIRDYCGEDNCLFCSNNASSFISAIKELEKSPNRVLEMKGASLEHANKLRIENIHKWFCNLKEKAS